MSRVFPEGGSLNGRPVPMEMTTRSARRGIRKDGRDDHQHILDPSRSRGATGFGPTSPEHISKGLILAQNERWRRGLGMQVVRPARDEAQG